MFRATTFLVCLAACALGCQQVKEMTTKTPPMSIDDMRKPSQAVQMRQLEPFLGSWEGTAEIVPPTGTVAATEPRRTFKGAGTSEWALDGMALKSTGWHEMPNDQRANYIEYITWDSNERKFRTFYMSDWGETGTGWMTPDPSGQTFQWNARGINAMGQGSSMTGSSTIVDRDTMEWTFVENGPMGRMEMKGTSKRTGSAASK